MEGGASASRTGKRAAGVGDAVAARRPGRSGCHIAQESRRHAAAAALLLPPSVVPAEEAPGAASLSHVWAIAGPICVRKPI